MLHYKCFFYTPLSIESDEDDFIFSLNIGPHIVKVTNIVVHSFFSISLILVDNGSCLLLKITTNSCLLLNIFSIKYFVTLLLSPSQMTKLQRRSYLLSGRTTWGTWKPSLTTQVLLWLGLVQMVQIMILIFCLQVCCFPI